MKLFFLLTACLGLAQANKCKRFTSDFVIALDNSNAIQDATLFKKMKCRAIDIISRLEIDQSPGRSLVAVSTYGANTIASFGKTAHTDNSALVNAVHALQYDGKTEPNLYTATNHMKTMVNKTSRRKDAKMFFIYITSGKHNANNVRTINRTIYEDVVHNQGIKMLAISTSPNNLQGTDLTNFNNLVPFPSRRSKLNEEHIHSQIQRFIVENCLDCYQPTIDMVFLLPNFRAFGRVRFDKMKKYVQDLLDMFTPGNAVNQVRVAVATFDTTAHTIFGLDTYTTITDLKTKINAITFDNSKTITKLDLSIHAAAQHALTNVLSNARSDATKILVSFGHIEYRSQTPKYSETFRMINNQRTYLHHVRFVNPDDPDPDLRWNSHDICLDGQNPVFYWG